MIPGAKPKRLIDFKACLISSQAEEDLGAETENETESTSKPQGPGKVLTVAFAASHISGAGDVVPCKSENASGCGRPVTRKR